LIPKMGKSMNGENGQLDDDSVTFGTVCRLSYVS
jgi:hypothetical protein